MSYNMYNRTVPTLARFTHSKIAQQTLLDCHPEAATPLASNAELDRQVWFRLARKPKADVAYMLVSHPLDLEKLNAFLDEKRVTVRRHLVSNGLHGCTDEMGELVFSQSWFDSELATIWLTANTVPSVLRKRVVIMDNANHLVRALSDTEMFTDEEVMALLPKIRFAVVRSSLYQLMDLRPSLVGPCATAGVDNPRLVEAAAGSRHLFNREHFDVICDNIAKLGGQSHHGSEILLTLIGNPNLPLDLLEQLLERFPTRLNGFGSRNRPVNNTVIHAYAASRLASREAAIGQAWQLEESHREYITKAIVVLGAGRYPTLKNWLNPTMQSLTPIKSTRGPQPAVKPDLSYLPAQSDRSLLSPETVHQVDVLLDPYGPAAWQTFWSLIDSWQGDLSSLVESSISLTD
jgi:hypothetical protein